VKENIFLERVSRCCTKSSENLANLRTFSLAKLQRKDINREISNSLFALNVGVPGEGNEDTNSANGSWHGLPITGKNNYYINI
jgi:hypothetical protein